MCHTFSWLAFHLISLHPFDTTIRACALSKCTLVSTMYCTFAMLLLYSSHTACTMIVNVLHQPSLIGESMHCYTFTVRHQRKIVFSLPWINPHVLLQWQPERKLCHYFQHSKFDFNWHLRWMNLLIYVQYVIKNLHHSYSVLCKSCHQNVHRNGTLLSHGEFELIETNTRWYCRLCNENIFAFNHIESDSEFLGTLNNFMNGSLCLDVFDRHQETGIFDPFQSRGRGRTALPPHYGFTAVATHLPPKYNGSTAGKHASVFIPDEQWLSSSSL